MPWKGLDRGRMDLKEFNHGRLLHSERKYSEAEDVFRKTVRRREQALGKDHKDTLDSKHWLGLALYWQKKYSEAKEMLQQAVRGKERTLGQDHKETLHSKQWLGEVLHKQGECSKAEKVFQEVVRGRERTLGQDHQETLYSSYCLGLALYRQGNFSDAEDLLQETVRKQEQALGRDHIDTLNSNYWLGKALYMQEKDSNAEGVLRQALRVWEQIYIQDDKTRLLAKYYLGRTLYRQNKYSEAEEVLQQTVRGQERTLGQDCKETLATIRLLNEVHGKLVSSLATSTTTQEAVANRLSGFFFKDRNSREPYTDHEITEISTLLQHSNPRWSKVPRVYVVLRTIGHLNLLDELIDLGFSDYWFPVVERNLPGCVLPAVRTSFVRAQSLVLTKSMDLEKGEKGQHCYYKQDESPPFERKGVLGRGAFGQVDKVLSMISFKEYARKQVPRSLAFRGRRKEDTQMFINEIGILKGLHHRHIVELLGSYTDSRHMALIMSPVAEMDLSTYLTSATESNRPELRTFFGCLATALEYLHEHKVRHKDIKPGNILVNHGNILLTDFGLSLDFTDADGSTTTSMVNGMTPRYCAPEVAQFQPRNTMSDIWSLGVVFMEMIVVLKGRTVQDMDEFFKQHGSREVFIRANPDALPGFIAELEGIGHSSDNRALGWTRKMLSAEQQLRPTASSLIASIVGEVENMRFCGICCVSPDDDYSDWEDE